MDEASYRSYLLRVWLTDGGEPHATVEDVASGRRRAFASLDELRSWLAGEVARGREGTTVD